MTDHIPIVSQVKSIVQLLFGQGSKALQTQINFVDATPILSQLKSIHEVFGQNDLGKALRTQKKFLIITSATIDGIPLVGHVKGLGHYFIGDFLRGHNCMKRADRSTVVILTGYFACTLLVPTTATMEVTCAVSAIGSMVGGVAMDSLLTVLENAMHKEGALNGTYFNLERALTEPDVGNVFDLLIGPLLDAMIGAFIGYKVYNLRNPPIAPPPQATAANVNAANGASANGGTAAVQSAPKPVAPILPPPVKTVTAPPMPSPTVPVHSGHVLHPRLPLPVPFNPNNIPSASTAIRYGAAASVVERHFRTN